MAAAPRGLTNFIRDIRNCTTKEDEKKRVNLELANIRTKFKQSDKLSSYDRKKYVWKLLYVYMLGYDVEFGHMEAVNLISSPKFAEKQVGYMVTSVLLNEHHEFLRLVINSIKTDICGRNDTFQALGLVLVANVGGKEFAESLAADVQRLLVSGTVRPVIRKKAALCLLRLFRRNPDVLNMDDWADVTLTLLDERDFGLLTSVLSLLHGLVSADAASFQGCIPKVVQLLERLVKNVDIPPDYLYYSMPSPWMQIKCMRILSHFPIADDPTVAGSVSAVLQRVIATGSESVKNQNKSNAIQAVLVEAVGLVQLLERDQELVDQMSVQLGRFITAKEPNTRYLGLENMGRLSVLPQVAAAVKRNEAQISESLHDADISIRRRALDLLYGMCDAGNAVGIVDRLLDYLVLSDFAIRDEIVLKVAILAEKFAPNQRWYIDVVLSLIDKAGDFVSDDIWHRVVQIVTNNPELQRYSAEQMLEKLRSGSAHETMIKVAGYLLGEFGHLLSVPVQEYFSLLQQRFPACSVQTKALLLSAYAKLATHADDAEVKAEIKAVFERYHAFADAELQQRSVEYFALSEFHMGTLKEVLAEMPRFPERASALEKRVAGDQEAPESQAVTLPRTTRSDRSDERATPAPQSAVAAPTTPGLLDLMGEDIRPAAPRASATTSADPLSQLMELASTSQPTAPASPPAVGGRGAALLALAASPGLPEPDFLGLRTPLRAAATAPLQDPALWLRRLAVSDAGVLYEDTFVQVGCKMEFGLAQARLTLFIGNKHVAPLVGMRASLQPIPGLRVEMPSMPAFVADRQQATAQLVAVCTAPFPAPPLLTFAYKLSDTQQEVTFEVRVPLFTSKFFSAPPPMDKTQYYEWWRLRTGNQKLESVVAASADLAAGGLPAWRTLFEGLRLSVLQGVDPNPMNLFAAGTFTAEGGVSSVCVVRLESDPRSSMQYRLSIASPSPTLAAALQKTLLPLVENFVR